MVPEGLWAEAVLGVMESQRPVLPLPLALPLEGGDGEDRGEGLCWLTHCATANPEKHRQTTPCVHNVPATIQPPPRYHPTTQKPPSNLPANTLQLSRRPSISKQS